MINRRKDRYVAARVETEIRWQLETIADSAGLSISEYLRHLIVNDLSQRGILRLRASQRIISPIQVAAAGGLKKEGVESL